MTIRRRVIATLTATLGLTAAATAPNAGIAHAALAHIPHNALTVCGGVGYHDLGQQYIDRNGQHIGQGERRACNGSTDPQWVTVTSMIGVVNHVEGTMTTTNGDSPSCNVDNSTNCTTPGAYNVSAGGSGASLTVNGIPYLVNTGF